MTRHETFLKELTELCRKHAVMIRGEWLPATRTGKGRHADIDLVDDKTRNRVYMPDPHCTTEMPYAIVWNTKGDLEKAIAFHESHLRGIYSGLKTTTDDRLLGYLEEDRVAHTQRRDRCIRLLETYFP